MERGEGRVRESRQTPWRERGTAEKSEKLPAKGRVPSNCDSRAVSYLFVQVVSVAVM